MLKSSPTFDNFVYQARIKIYEGKDVGLAFRIQANGDMYLVRTSGCADDKTNPADPNEGAKTALWKYSGGWVKIANFSMGLVPMTGSFYSVKVTANGSNISWSYKVGDIWSQTYTATDATFSAGSVGFKSVGGSSHHHYDDAFIADLETGYIYDAESQLLKVSNPDGTAMSYVYDVNGNRTQATTDLYKDDFSATSINPVWGSSSISSWTLESGELSASVVGSGTLLKAGADINDYTLQARINMQQGKDVGLAVRVTSDTSFYMVRCSGLADDSGTALWKWTASGPTRLANFAFDPSLPLPPQSGWYILKVVAIGSKILWQYQVNGIWSNITYAWDDTNSPYTTGGVGIRVASRVELTIII